MPSKELSVPVTLPSIWSAVAGRTPATVDPPPLERITPLQKAALDVLHVHGLYSLWWTDDFTTALVAAIGSATPFEQLRLLPLYPELVYCTRTLRDDEEGRERLLDLAGKPEG